MTQEECDAIVDRVKEQSLKELDVIIASAVRQFVEYKLHEEIRYTIKAALDNNLYVSVRFDTAAIVPEEGPHGR